MGARERNKGARGERELAAWLKERGYSARRGRQYSGSPDSPDVVCSGVPFHFECKRTERIRLYDAMAQAVAMLVTRFLWSPTVATVASG